MAAFKEESIDIVLVFGHKKIPIHLDLNNDDGSESITVRHLAEKVKKETNVEPSCQKLIYKGNPFHAQMPLGEERILSIATGKALFKTDDAASLKDSLSSFGIHNGDRVMLLARKPDHFSAVDKATDQSKKKVNQVPEHQRLQNVQIELDKICLRCDELVKESQTVSVQLDICEKEIGALSEKLQNGD